jgi:hypothetical protein
MSYTQNNIPYAITMEPVTIQNGWYLIIYNNTLGIRKNNTQYYYSTNNGYHLGNTRPIVDNTPNLVYVGEYKPVMLDSNYFASLPLNINNNVFFVNQLTRIVYIKPTDLVIIIPQTMPYNFKLYEGFTFAGNYNPYLNSTSTSNKSFSDVIPKTVPHKTAKVDTSERHHIDPVENTLTDNPYPKSVTETTVVNKQIFNFPSYGEKTANIVTFIIPFLHNLSTNTISLCKTIESIMKNVKLYKIFVIINNQQLQLPEHISKMITILPYAKYVGRLGYENKLNMKINNGYDIASFYNLLITNLVKTQLYTIWNYNWVIEEWNDTINSSKCFSVPNYYIDEEEAYKSNKYGRVGYILYGKMKYITSMDGFDISVNGISINNMDNKIKVRGNYDIIDYTDRKCILSYGNEVEIKTFFENKENFVKGINFV